MTNENHAKDQAELWLKSIIDVIKLYNDAVSKGYNEALERASEEIGQGPLSVEVRSAWTAPALEGFSGIEPAEYRVLLCTGGPAVRIIGDLSEDKTPSTVRLQYQDWGTPWEDLDTSTDEEETLLQYANMVFC